MAIWLGDGDIARALQKPKPYSRLEVALETAPPHPFLALIDSDREDVLELVTHVSSYAFCRAILIWGNAALDATPAMPLRTVSRPIRLNDLVTYCETLWRALPLTPREIAPHLMFHPRERLLVHSESQSEQELTDKESAILIALANAAEAGLHREQLLAEVWGYRTDMETHTLETHLYRLRQKLEKMQAPHLLRVENGRYRLVTKGSAA